MKHFYFILPFLLGILAVLQAGLNRILSKSHALPSVVFFNNSVVLGFSLLTWLFFQKWGAPTFKGSPLGVHSFQWWYLLPGLAGFLFVLLLPHSIARLGASRVFIMLVLAQIIGGFMWDMYVENQSLSFFRYLALLLAVLATVFNMI